MTFTIRKITSDNINDVVDDLALLLYSQQPQTLADYKDIIYNYLTPDIYDTLSDSELSSGISLEEAEKVMKRLSEAWSRALVKGSV